MNEINFFEKIKITEVARKFMALYQYREVKIQNIDGIFLENKGSKFPLIRISNKEYNNIQEFNEDLNTMKRVMDEYARISQIENPRCLCIYFGGVVEQQVDNIYSITISGNLDLANNDIIKNDFPLIIQNLDLSSFDELIDSMQNQFNASMLNQENNTNQKAARQRKVININDKINAIKKLKFAIYFPIIFIAVNLFALFAFINLNAYNFDLSFYSPFVVELNQYYRMFTSVFLNPSIIFIIVIAYFYFKYSAFIELRLGTAKTVLVFLIGLVFLYASMFFVASGSVFSGSAPLLAILSGSYIGTSLVPSEKANLKANLLRSGFLFVVTVVFVALEAGDYIPSVFAFLGSMAAVLVLGVKKQKVKLNYLGSLVVVLLIIIGSSFIPDQTLKQSYSFEQDYLEYVAYSNKKQAKQYSEKLDKYYEDLGAVNYND